VFREPERLATVDADHLVDAIAELEPAVLDRNATLLERKVFAVEIEIHRDEMITEEEESRITNRELRARTITIY
jgi:hypothetical protein